MNLINISDPPINQLCSINSSSLGVLSDEIALPDSSLGVKRPEELLGKQQPTPFNSLTWGIHLLIMSYLTPYDIAKRLSEEIAHNEKVMSLLCSQYWPQKPPAQEDNVHTHFTEQCAFAVVPIAHSLLPGYRAPICGMTTLNNNHLAFGSSPDNTVSLLNMHNRQIRPLHQHEGGIDSVLAFKNLVASASTDRTVRVSDLSGQTVVLSGHISITKALSFLNENTLVSGSYDQTLIVWEIDWDLKEGKRRHLLEGHEGSITAVAFADKNTIFSASDDNVLKIWNLSEGTARNILEGSQVKNLAVCSGRVVSDASDFTLKMWNLAGEITHVLHGHTKRITGLAFLDQHTLASTSLDGTLRIWDGWDGRLIRILTGAPRTSIVSLGMLTSGQIVCGSRLDGIKMWDPQPFFIILNINRYLPIRDLSLLVADYLFTSNLTVQV